MSFEDDLKTTSDGEAAEALDHWAGSGMIGSSVCTCREKLQKDSTDAKVRGTRYLRSRNFNPRLSPWIKKR